MGEGALCPVLPLEILSTQEATGRFLWLQSPAPLVVLEPPSCCPFVLFFLLILANIFILSWNATSLILRTCFGPKCPSDLESRVLKLDAYALPSPAPTFALVCVGSCSNSDSSSLVPSLHSEISPEDLCLSPAADTEASFQTKHSGSQSERQEADRGNCEQHPVLDFSHAEVKLYLKGKRHDS